LIDDGPTIPPNAVSGRRAGRVAQSFIASARFSRYGAAGRQHERAGAKASDGQAVHLLGVDRAELEKGLAVLMSFGETAAITAKPSAP
jgi:hypothetical protein